MAKRSPKALLLFSGGLDSLLAGEVLRRNGVQVTCLTFTAPFLTSEKAVSAARLYDYPLIIAPLPERVYINLLTGPPHGFGKYMNPCIDCHALMLRTAGNMMKQRGYDFLATGEVAGERPKSQTIAALRRVDEASGFGDYILRPLSAKLLPPTAPEREGLIDRNRLLAISGRGRKIQIALAQEWHIKKYPSPAGGCPLTEKLFSLKLRRFMKAFEGQISFFHIALLRVGRHFLLPPKAHLVIGRDMKENKRLLQLRLPWMWLVNPINVKGPVALLYSRDGLLTQENFEVSARFVARYSDHEGDPVRILMTSEEDRLNIVTKPAHPAELEKFRI